MSDPVVLTFTTDELRQLRAGAAAMLEGPLGVYPGSPREAAARVSAAMKLLRAYADATGRKFIDLPSLAPFASRVIVETVAGPAAAPLTAITRAKKRPAKATNGGRQRAVAGARGRRRAADVPLPLVGADAPPDSPEER